MRLIRAALLPFAERPSAATKTPAQTQQHTTALRRLCTQWSASWHLFNKLPPIESEL